ncbi:PqiB family protein [Candidimonas nitroreducens]|uniref:Paraquat-inducible protein B n=1 Tax=Candidimonas nitroreducens TaxID=683354 RepID=A0A225LZV0_9BURK|nr:MlaD family protein [Candidimonas nitroreducens]OWT53483.1 paraquat-inducible protein B [Candidimonas nitroreducens]
MDASSAGAPLPPRVVPKRQTRISWIWLIPILAAVIGLSLVVRAWMQIGPVVTISFESADGLEVGQTKVRYKDVAIGVVKDIKVSQDRSRVLVKIQISRDSSDYVAREGTRFWVVRPRLGITGVSGLGTLLSGAYISVDTTNSQAGGSAAKYHFTGLEKPPEVASDRPGRRYTVTAPDLGSLEIGSPVYYRRIQVGRVVGYDLDPGGSKVRIQIFVDAPNDKFVTRDARFWNVSGINISLNGDGLAVQTGSLAAIVSGGISFSHGSSGDSTPAPANAVFELKANEAEAEAQPDGPPFPINLVFPQSVRGLKVGAPVDFRGIELGKVEDITLEYDRKEHDFVVLVKTVVYPSRLGAAYESLYQDNVHSGRNGGAALAPLVKKGLRAQLRVSNLLTGQQYVALDFFQHAAPVEFDVTADPVQLPTLPGNFDRLQQQLGNIVDKLGEVQFGAIGSDLQDLLKSLTRLSNRLNDQVAPQATAALKAARRSLGHVDTLVAPGSALNGNLDQTLRELQAAAKSLRALSDYLQAHPSSMLRGNPADVLPGQ